jgi:dGTPase
LDEFIYLRGNVAPFFEVCEKGCIMRTRKDYEAIEEQLLAPYACKSADSEGRKHQEKEHPYRTAFQRDRDRVIHSKAFRRLELKTQVFVAHEGDHYRTRLTHTMEGAQIARTIARAMQLNEDLAEAIILAHDLGHTPFGHVGQDVMNRLMKDHGGFEHNHHSLRIVTQLENQYSDFPGLNLSYEVLEGIAKHNTSYDTPQISFKKKGLPTLEAQLVDKADEIAYCSHDLDDGLRSGLIQIDQLKDIVLWERHYRRIKRGTGSEKVIIRQVIKAVLNHMVTDLVEESEKNIQKMKLNSVADVRKAKKKCVQFSHECKKMNKELKAFLYKNMYRHYRVERMAAKAEIVIKDLFNAYSKNPKILPPAVFKLITKKTSPELVVCDYIAGMTDRFALEEHAKLFDPRVKV